MEVGTHHERPKDHKHENVASNIFNTMSFLPWALHKLPEAFGLEATKSWYPHYFYTEGYLY